jgi:tRNA(fMet)-specific endonuclease VapC
MPRGADGASRAKLSLCCGGTTGRMSTSLQPLQRSSRWRPLVLRTYQPRIFVCSPEGSKSRNVELVDDGPAVLDTDTLSELSRGNPSVRSRAAAYLAIFGRLTITSVTVFERLRGYRAAIRAGKPFERHLQAFTALVADCIVLPFDQEAAGVAAQIWAGVTRRERQQLGDILIAAVAISRQLPLVTGNRRDFERFIAAAGADVRLIDWARPSRRSGQ